MCKNMKKLREEEVKVKYVRTILKTNDIHIVIRTGRLKVEKKPFVHTYSNIRTRPR